MRSSLNSLKHGITAKTIVIRDEDPIQFDRLLEEIEDECTPQTAVERELVDRIAGIL